MFAACFAGEHDMYTTGLQGKIVHTEQDKSSTYVQRANKH